MEDFLNSIMQDPTVKAAIGAITGGQLKQHDKPASPAPSVLPAGQIQNDLNGTTPSMPAANPNANLTQNSPTQTGVTAAPESFAQGLSDAADRVSQGLASPVEGGLMGLSAIDKASGLDPNQVVSKAANAVVNNLPALGPEFNVDIPGASEIGMGTKMAANDVGKAVDDTMATAKAQPGGLQTGSIGNLNFRPVKPGEVLPQGYTTRMNMTTGEQMTNAPDPDAQILDDKGNPAQYVPDTTNTRTFVNNSPTTGEANFVPGKPTVPQYAQETPPVEGLSPIGEENTSEPSAQFTQPQPPKFTPGQNNKPSNPMLTDYQAHPQDNAKYQSIFEVPSSVVSKMRLKPAQVVNQLIDDGVVGKNLNELSDTANGVTGATGGITNINNYILSKTHDLADYGDAQRQIDGLPIELADEKGALVNQVKREVNAAMQPVQYENTPPEFPSNHAYAGHLFQVSQNLGSVEDLFMKKALDVNGDIKNPEYDRAADIVGNIKKSVDDAINTATGEDFQKYKNDPYVLSQLQRLPQKLARRWLDNAKTFKNSRTAAYPYVQLGKMVNYTNDRNLATFSKAIKESQGKLPSPMNTVLNAGEHVVNAVTNPGSMVSKGVFGALKRATAPKGIQPFTPEWDAWERSLTTPKYNSDGTPIQTPSAQLKSGMGIKGKVALGGLGVTALTGAYLLGQHNEPATNAYSQPNTNPSQQQHNGGTISNNNKNVNSIPDPSTIKDANGLALNESIGNITPQITDLINQNKTLVKQAGAQSYLDLPPTAKQQYDANTQQINLLQTQQATAQKFIDQNTQTTQQYQALEKARNIVGKAPPSWFKTMASGNIFEQLYLQSTPAWQQWHQALSNIPGHPDLSGVFTASTPDAASAAIDQQESTNYNNYKTWVKENGGSWPVSNEGGTQRAGGTKLKPTNFTTPPGPAGNQTDNLPSPTEQGLPAVGESLPNAPAMPSVY